MSAPSPVTMRESEATQIQRLHALLQLGSPVLRSPATSELIHLPPSVYSILKDVVAHLRFGRGVVVVPAPEQVTTQTAANILGVSRPHFIKLLESGEIPFARTGSHRRVLLADIKSYEKKRDKERSVVINRLAKQAMAEGSYEGTPVPEGGEDE